MKELSIAQWSEEDRPREKLEKSGASALSDAELLAILIGSGSREESAVGLMKHLLNDCNNNLNTLGKMSIIDLEQYKGLGPAKAITIIAACEFGKRRQMAEPGIKEELNSAENIYRLMHPRLQDLNIEEFWAIFMNQSYKLIKAVKISHGGITETAVDIRVIMKEAIMCNATILAVCHNHPSNNPHPSSQDDSLTKQIQNACKTLRIFFADHVVIADGSYYSYCDEGKL